MFMGEFDLICLKIAKAGYWGGDPYKVSKATPDWIIKTLDYQNFCNDYEQQLHTLNRNNENR